jgi:hypothetical protein
VVRPALARAKRRDDRSAVEGRSRIQALGRAFNLSAGEQSYLLTCDRGQGILSIGTERAALQVVASESEHLLATSDPAEIAALQEQPS